MKRLTAITLIALLAATPALADDVYRCADGSTLTYSEDKGEMTLRGVVDGFDFVLPFAGSASRFATWSRTLGPEGVGCGDDTAPCVDYWQPRTGNPVVTYQLAPGTPQVECSPQK